MTTILTAYVAPRDNQVHQASVEVDIKPGIGIHVIGLADQTVKEALLRTITALQACGYHIPGKKIIINITPADLCKSGEGFDLPIALGILLEQGAVNFDSAGFTFHGQLGLDGSIRTTGNEQAILDKGGLRGAMVCGRICPEDAEYEYSNGRYTFANLRELIDYAEYCWRD